MNDATPDEHTLVIPRASGEIDTHSLLPDRLRLDRQGPETSKLRGHDTHFDEDLGESVYTDTGEPIRAVDRPCGECGLYRTREGHDPCIAGLPGVMNACCGHGEPRLAYVQFRFGGWLGGQDAIDYFETEDTSR